MPGRSAGGTNWGWYAYDRENMIYFGTGNRRRGTRPSSGRQQVDHDDLRPRRPIRSGHFGYQKTPHDEWDYAGVNVMMLSEQKDKDGKMRKVLTHPDRNGIVYTLDRTDGSLVSANRSTTRSTCSSRWI